MNHASDPMIGRVLDGRYRILSRIARGGMAMVYEATDLRLDRSVAIKVMHAGLAEDPEFVERFEREARSAARLSHPNVVAVFDTGDDEGTLFLVMEHVPGRTLRELIRTEAPFTPQRALTVLEPILRALSAAHGAGMIHRDMKPENVLLTASGDVKVVDFGLARAVNAETQHTATGGVLIGTVSYLSPELVVDGKADARADVYASGVMLYEMLTGAKPHQAESPIQVAYKHVHEDIPAPSLVTAGLPPYVDALVARATARDGELRPADARVLLQQVRRVHSALDHGVADDPELTADLMPRRTVSMADDELTVMDPFATGELPGQIIDPSAPDASQQILDSQEFGPGSLDEPTAAVPREVIRQEPRPEPRPVAATPSAAVSFEDEDPAYADVPRRRSRRGPLLLVGLVVLALLVALGGWWFGAGRYTVTPGVIDLPVTAARAKAKDAGLKLRVTKEVFSETVAAGAVISTVPSPGERILKSGTLEAVVSQGPERHTVPLLKGLTVSQVTPELEDVTLTLGKTTEKFHEKIPKGQVITSTPEAGKRVKRGTAVDIVVSKGRQPIKIPDFTNKPADRAEAKLTELGFEVDAAEPVFHDSVRKGMVISQNPSSGTGFKGDKISLKVSKGPEMVTVPDVRRQSYEEASDALTALGLKVRSERSDLYIGFDRVAGSDPAPGKKVRKGATVTLQLV